MSILELIQRAELTSDSSSALCTVASQLSATSGGAVGLLHGNNDLTRFGANGPLAQRLLDHESTVGEGPCLTSSTTDEAVIEPDLGAAGPMLWPVYTSLAYNDGVRAVFAFPVRIGAVRLGGLLIYRLNPGALSDAQLSDCYLMASIIASAILASQAGATQDVISRELERSATFDFVVQQAAGMISVQGSVSILDALVLLRAHGFSTGMTSSELSARVVARDIHYEQATMRWFNSDGSHHELLV